jgi:hypothetical protein
MPRASRLLALALLAGCSPPDPRTPEGFSALFIAEVRAENWGGIFDLLTPEGRETLKEDILKILAEAKDPAETGVTLNDLSSLPLRDVFLRLGQASISNPKYRQRLRDHYGLATFSTMEGTDVSKRVALNRKTEGTETLFLSLADGRWGLHRFPWDWRR